VRNRCHLWSLFFLIVCFVVVIICFFYSVVWLRTLKSGYCLWGGEGSRRAKIEVKRGEVFQIARRESWNEFPSFVRVVLFWFFFLFVVHRQAIVLMNKISISNNNFPLQKRIVKLDYERKKKKAQNYIPKTDKKLTNKKGKLASSERKKIWPNKLKKKKNQGENPTKMEWEALSIVSSFFLLILPKKKKL